MSKPTKEEIKAAFQVADKDGNGKLSASEVKGLMVALGEDVDDENTADIVKMVISMGDTDGDKMLNYEEIVRVICEEPDEKEMMKAMFNMYDADRNGQLAKKELAEFAKSMTGRKEGAQMLLAMADQDKDGMLSFKEYCELMGV